SKGTMAGACLGLFVLALVDRWIAAVRPMMEGNGAPPACKNTKGEEKDENGKGRRGGGMCLHAPTFVPADDVMRGVLHALQAVLGFAFMLAILIRTAGTFQAAFILALVLSLGLGEVLFG
ncbi:hypothetical protein FB451DRAFT_972056, partial [Mycena latifolia]